MDALAAKALARDVHSAVLERARNLVVEQGIKLDVDQQKVASWLVQQDGGPLQPGLQDALPAHAALDSMWGWLAWP